MAKITVEVAAKRLGMDPNECLKRLQEMGLMVRDQLDKIDADVFQQVKARLDEEKLRAESSGSSTSERVGSRVIRRRRKAVEPEEVPVEEAVVEQAIEPEVHFEPAQEPEVEVPVEQPTAEIEAAPESIVELEVAVEAPTEPEVVEAPAEDAAVPEPAVPEPAVVGETEAPAEAPKPVEPAAVVDAVATEAPAEEKKTPEAKVAEPAPRRRRTVYDAVTPKQINVHDPGHEPARILSKPKVPVETIKPRIAPRQDIPPRAPDPAGTGERRERKGRRVVDFGDRSRRRDQEREGGFMRRGRQRKKKSNKQTEITTPKAIKRKIKVPDQISVGDLAKRMGVKGGDLIKKLLALGMMVTVNQDIDFETATILASDFGLEVENATVLAEDLIAVVESNPEHLESRPPVVTVMGHVDHGKTSLLDAIRETDVASGEAGGITQHISSFNVTLADGRRVTFVDTPGHHSFAAMRARGAQVTDIVILVVAADDGVMPQTVESINHAKAAGVPIVVAINKIDKDNAQPDKIIRELMEHGLVPESLGGEDLFAHVSAKNRVGIEQLLETVLLQSEMMELKSDPTKNCVAIVLDARLERGRGPVANVIVKEGTLHQGDYMVADTFHGRVRMMFDDKGKLLTEVTPAYPAQVVGLNGVPAAGLILNMLVDEKKAKAMASLRQDKVRADEQKKRSNIRLEDLYAKAQEGVIKELRVVIKCDVHGSSEAVRDSLLKLGNDEIQVKVIHAGVGTITETDVNLASPADAIIIGFNVRPEAKAKRLAESLGVEIRMYSVIYDLIDEVRAALEGMLDPTITEVINGVAEVRNTFHIRRVGTVAGCYVLEGKILRNSKVRLVRDGVVVYSGSVGNLKRFKDDAKEVASGFECGIGIDGCNDIKEGDKIESFRIVEERSTL
jgi:translation initiation factor IF-2